MAAAVCFYTTSLIPIESFTTFGINYKPMTKNPIGFFGTGLKYAIAVLCRHGIKVRLLIGEVEYEFYADTDYFRGKEFQFIKMRRRKSIMKKWFYEKLPFTTELGKNWDLWQAFRELESNTRDENGITIIAPVDDIEPEAGKTKIIVTSDAFWRIATDDLHKIFLPSDLEPRWRDDKLEIYNKPSEHIYYRGLRVHDFKEHEGSKSMYTYNILEETRLTEDRTLMYMFEARERITKGLSRCNDITLLKSIIQASSVKGFFEEKLDWDYVFNKPSDEFMSLMKSMKKNRVDISSRLQPIYSRYLAPTPPKQYPKPQGGDTIDRKELLKALVWWNNNSQELPTEFIPVLEQTIEYLEPGKSKQKVDGGSEQQVDNLDIPF